MLFAKKECYKMKYLALVGADCPSEAVKALRRRKDILDVAVLPPDTLISSPIATHPDTILFIGGGKLYCHADYAEKNAALLSYICSTASLETVTDTLPRSGVYPHDCAYNALALDGTDTVIGNKKALCPALAELCSVNTKQGYAACCALSVKGKIITADPSIKKAAENAGIEVLTVSGGDIALRGYDTGFIGGAAGAFEDKLFCIGNTNDTVTGRQLQSICEENEISLISLCGGALTDTGGIKFIPIPCHH